jgi:hypothetical protein
MTLMTHRFHDANRHEAISTMRIHASRLLLAIAALAAALAAIPQAAAQADAGTTQQPEPVSSLFRRAAQAIGSAFLGGVSSSQAQEPQPKLVDPWKAQAGLRMVRRLLDGDQLGVVVDMARNPELEQLWGNPRATFRLLQNYPMLGGIKGVKEIMAKSEEAVTTEDVSASNRVHAGGLNGRPDPSIGRLFGRVLD